MSASELPGLIRIETGSRLHFGPLSYLPEQGRHFGGIGLMVQQPGVVLIAEGNRESAHATTGSVRAVRFGQKILAEDAGLKRPINLRVEREISPHQGLGSGTQLGLAVAEAVLRLNNRVFENTAALAKLVGRGQRSAIGIFGYERGGFIIEAGQAQPEEIGALACRLDFPTLWTMELISIRNEDGMHGDEERQVFQQLIPMQDSLSEKLCKIAITEMLPAIQQVAADAWCNALDEYGQRIGEFFAASQGGIYSTPLIRELVEHLRNHKITGIAQSSWGPTIAVFCPQEKREELHRMIQKHPGAKALLIQTAAPMNTSRKLIVE